MVLDYFLNFPCPALEARGEASKIYVCLFILRFLKKFSLWKVLYFIEEFSLLSPPLLLRDMSMRRILYIPFMPRLVPKKRYLVPAIYFVLKRLTFKITRTITSSVYM